MDSCNSNNDDHYDHYDHHDHHDHHDVATCNNDYSPYPLNHRQAMPKSWCSAQTRRQNLRLQEDIKATHLADSALGPHPCRGCGSFCAHPTSSEFLELCHARPEIESLFNNMKGTAQERRRRCRHYGYRLNWLDRINQMLRRNQMALMNFQKRGGLSPG